MLDFTKDISFEGTMIFSDFDGTLTDSNGKIPQPNIDALNYYTDHGGKFTVCTGRTVQGFHQYDHSFINAPVVLANGCMCYDYRARKTVFFEGIGVEGYDFIRKIRDNFPKCSIEIYPIFLTYCIHTSVSTIHHLQGQSIEFTTINDPDEIECGDSEDTSLTKEEEYLKCSDPEEIGRFRQCPTAQKHQREGKISQQTNQQRDNDETGCFQKIMIDCGEQSIEVQNFCRENIVEPMFIETTGSFVEFIKSGRGKEYGALRLSRELGIDKKNVFCVGDGYNDKTMLEAFDLTFCPSDASVEAMSAAKNVVCSRNDGTLYGVVEYLQNKFINN